MASHRIHLRGPWDCSWTGISSSATETVPQTGTINMPQEWRALFGELHGKALFRRKFHRPTNLEPHERVIIVLTEVRGSGAVRINDLAVSDFVASGEQIEFEISTLMKPFNQIAVEIAFDPLMAPQLPGGLFGVVALEIRS